MASKTEKKLAYLQGTKDAIRNAIIAKGQAVSDTDTFRSYADKIAAISGGGGQNDTILLEEQELSFTLNSNYGVYSAIAPMPTNALVIGETYRVKWGEDEFTCVAMDGSSVMPGAVFIGNGSGWGLSGNNEPFLIVCDPSAQYADVISLTDAEPTTRIVKVWQEHTSADLVYVTFMSYDGTKELHKRAVVKGNTCMCPVTGVLPEMDAPPKESTAEHNFTLAGWATTPNGGLDENALKDVTEDRTVYANYIATIRTYAVRFFNGNTQVGNTQYVAYGMSATPPVVEKEGYRLDGWSADYTNITGDTDCYAVWTEKLTFANATWAEIAEISEAGEASSYFKVGDTKQVACGDEIITVTVAGFNHDDLSDGSGKAGMSIVCTTVPTTTSHWGNGSAKNYVNSYAYTAKNNLLADLPTELQAVIKPVDKTYDTTNAEGTSPTTGTVSESLWLLSAAELGYDWSGTLATKNVTKLGSRYELFTSGNIATYTSLVAPKIYNCAGEKADVWTRNTYRAGTYAPLLLLWSVSASPLPYLAYLWYWDDKSKESLLFGFCI